MTKDVGRRVGNPQKRTKIWGKDGKSMENTFADLEQCHFSDCVVGFQPRIAGFMNGVY
jgi:hypothetical protein